MNARCRHLVSLLTACFAGAALAANLDPTFGTAGRTTIPHAKSPSTVADMAIDPTGRIVVTGPSGNASGTARLLVDGRLDTTFNGTGMKELYVGTSPEFTPTTALAVQPDSKVILGAWR